jgi:recombination protein RecT
VAKTPDLAKVPAAQLIAELINCSRLGLEPNVEGGRWLLPFKRKVDGREVFELVPVTDYRGLIDIARRSGEVLAIHADVVREKDKWEFWIDAGGATLVHLHHRRSEGERGEILGAYAIVKLKNGEVQATFVTLAEISSARSRSRGADSKFSPWVNDFEAMAKKTAIRRLYNLLPKTPDISEAREVLAEEDRTVEMEVTEAPAGAPGASATARVKEKLKAKVAPQVAPANNDPPDSELGLRPPVVTDYEDDEPEGPMP